MWFLKKYVHTEKTKIVITVKIKQMVTFSKSEGL